MFRITLLLVHLLLVAPLTFASGRCESALSESESEVSVQISAFEKFATFNDFRPGSAMVFRAQAELLQKIQDINPKRAQQLALKATENGSIFGTYSAHTEKTYPLYLSIKSVMMSNYFEPQLSARFFRNVSQNTTFSMAVVRDPNFLHDFSNWLAILPTPKSPAGKILSKSALPQTLLLMLDWYSTQTQNGNLQNGRDTREQLQSIHALRQYIAGSYVRIVNAN